MYTIHQVKWLITNMFYNYLPVNMTIIRSVPGLE